MDGDSDDNGQQQEPEGDGAAVMDDGADNPDYGGFLHDADVGGTAVNERLYQQAFLQAERRRQMANLLDANCTFQPEINKRRASTGGKIRPDSAGSPPPHERLYLQALEHERKLRDLRNTLDENCTFSPALSKKALDMKKHNQTATHGAYDVLYQKALATRAKLEELRQRAGLDGCTFSPQLSRKAAQLRRPGTASARLYNPDWVKQRRQAERNNPEREAMFDCTFKPTTLSGRRKSKDGTAGGHQVGDELLPQGPVFDRLYEMGLKMAEEQKAIKVERELVEAKECTFAPNISKSKASAKVLGISPGGNHDAAPSDAGGKPSQGDPYNRLYTHALERLERLKMQPTAQELGCTFSPQLSKVSRRITETMRTPETADLPRHLILYEDGLQRQQARAAPEQNQQGATTTDDEVNCTFQPRITHLPSKSVTMVPVHDRLYENARTKQAVLAAAAFGAPLPLDGNMGSPTRAQEEGEIGHLGGVAATTGRAVPVDDSSMDGGKEMFLI